MLPEEQRNRNTYVRINSGMTPLITSQEVDSVAGTMQNGQVESDATTVYSRYWYPKLRFSLVFQLLVTLDVVVAVILWLTGGDSHYFTQNIVQFDFKQSVFDLAIISILKLPLYCYLIGCLERVTIQSLDDDGTQNHFTESGVTTYQPVLAQRQRNTVLVLSVLSFLILTMSVVKGSLILRDILVGGAAHESIHPTYYACVIWCVTMAVMCLILSLVSGLAVRRLQKQRILKYYNSCGQEVNQQGKPIPSNATLFKLFKLAKPEAGLIAAASVALLLSTAVQTVAPIFFGKVVDAAQQSMELLDRTVLILLAIYVAGAVFSLVRSWLFNLAGQRFVARLRKQLFQSIVVQDVAFFDINRTGELCNRLASDTTEVQKAVTVNMSMLCRYTLQILGSLVVMFYLNAALTGVLLAVVPVVSLSAMQYGKFVRKIGKQLQDRLADGGTHAEETLSSVRTVKSFSGETKAVKLYSNSITESYKVGRKLAIAQGSMDGLFSLLAYGAVSAVLWYGGKLVYDNHQGLSTGITPGILTSFLLYTLQVAMGFALLSSLYGDFMQAVGASTRIFALLDRKPEIFMPRHPLVLSTLTGELEFQRVTFTYPSRPETQVLKGMSFRVEPGQMVALVGPSGGGKSTVVSLIERFYDPDEGSILIGGCDLKLLDLTWFRQQVAMVSQEPVLFACSIRDNIAYGREATMEEVIEAAKQANAHEFVMQFEQGYDTLVGERGVRLSGGQKQRVAIARALIMDPTVLLLDEATSALDAESEHLVQEAIDRAMKGRTVIVIAHRLSTVRNAHKVIVIDKGSIAEMGTHTELLSRQGVYKKLVLRQLTAAEATRSPESSRTTPQLAAASQAETVTRNTNSSNVSGNGDSSYRNGGFSEDEEEHDSTYVDLIDLK